MHMVEAKGILSAKNGMNLYRGCTHGCIYCDSRSTCYQMKHDFEDIEVKRNAVELLEESLKKKRQKCMIGTGAMTDPYMPLELQLNQTRKCLEIIDKYGFGLAIQTKSTNILRDLDLLEHINEQAKCVVQMTLTTYDEALCKIIEPNVATTKQRAEVLNVLKSHHIPTVVWLTPLLPFINDTKENLDGILDLCFEAGVRGILCFGIGVTLREGDREYFYAKLDEHFKGMKERYINTFGNAYEVQSPNHKELIRHFHKRCKEAGVMSDVEQIFHYMHTFETKGYEQLSLFS